MVPSRFWADDIEDGRVILLGARWLSRQRKYKRNAPVEERKKTARDRARMIPEFDIS